MVQNTGKMFTGPKLKKDIGAPSENIQRPVFEGYMVFVQSMGSGARHLKTDTTLLYQVLVR